MMVGHTGSKSSMESRTYTAPDACTPARIATNCGEARIHTQGAQGAAGLGHLENLIYTELRKRRSEGAGSARKEHHLNGPREER